MKRIGWRQRYVRRRLQLTNVADKSEYRGHGKKSAALRDTGRNMDCPGQVTKWD